MVNQVGQFSLSNLPSIKADAYKRHILQKATRGTRPMTSYIQPSIASYERPRPVCSSVKGGISLALVRLSMYERSIPWPTV